MSAVAARDLQPGYVLSSDGEPATVDTVRFDLYQVHVTTTGTWKGFPCIGFLDFALDELVEVVEQRGNAEVKASQRSLYGGAESS